MRQFWSKAAQTKSILLALSLTVLLSVSCKKKDADLGLNLRSDNGLIDAIINDTLEVVAYTVEEDSIRTDSLNSNVVGAINDQIFGTSVANLFTSFQLEEVGFDFGTAPTLDSIVLSMVYYNAEKFYGDTNSTIKLNFYKLEDELLAADKYYSNTTFSTSDLLGSWEGKFHVNDSTTFIEDKESKTIQPTLRIRLNDAFGQQFLDNAPSSFTSQEEFEKFLKGIAIVPDASGLNTDEGVMVPLILNAVNSNLSVYYNDSLHRDFNMNTNAQKVNTYDLSGWNTDIQNQLANPGQNYPLTYLQSMGGLKTKIEIPKLFDLVADGDRIIVNEAKIVFQNDETTTANDLFFSPDRLLLLQPSESDGSNSLIIDLIDEIAPPNSAWSGHTNYGGSKEDGAYEFHFNRHLQGLLDEYLATGENKNRGFYLIVPSDRPITPARMVLDNSSKKIALKITYTKL